MLEVQRRSYATAKVNKPTDFLARNRKAAVRSTKPDPRKKEEHDKRPPAKPRASKPLKAPTAAATATADTVTISKDYLDQLMQMSVAKNQPRATEVDRVVPSHIPGLESRPPDGMHAGGGGGGVVLVRVPSPYRAPQQLTQHEQWLSELSAQADEQRGRREREKAKRINTPEDYCPWGRPGGGAPIRDESGAVVNLYRHRAKNGQIADIRVEPVAEQHNVSHDLQLPTHNGSHDPRSHEVFSERQKTPEDYCPWGRPGGGAPIRDESGAVVNLYRHRAKNGQIADTTVNSVAKKSVAKRQYASHDPHPPSHPPPISTAATATVDSSPRHARGAGPYVDKYILQDRDRQRQRNLDNTAFIKAQIAEKERIKLEAKLERGREERVEERRMARERERLDKEFQREQLRKRAKEEEATQRMYQMQQRIDQASEQAMAAKLEAKTNKLTPHPPRVARGGGGGRTVRGSNFASELQSPSMILQSVELDNSKAPRAANNRNEPGGGVGRRQQVQQGGGATAAAARRRRPSRIPVPEKSQLPQRRNEQRDKQRSLSPPLVNATARKVKGQIAPLQGARKPRPVHREIRDSPKRSISPQLQRFPSPPVPALAKRLARHPPAEEARQPSPPVARQPSPPVPALAKKLTQQAAVPARLPSPPLKTEAAETTPPANGALKCSPESAELAINRPPSCDPIKAPVSNVPHLPTVTVATTQAVTSHYNMLHQQDPSLNRQKTILLELAMLREGIISYTDGIDKRVDRILTKKTCNF